MKRFLFLATAFIFSIIICNYTSYAEENTEYKSNGNIGFYGKYTYPEKSESPHTNDNDKKVQADKIDDKKTQLPLTGEKRDYYLVALGGTILIIACGLLGKNKKNGEKNEKN